MRTLFLNIVLLFSTFFQINAQWYLNSNSPTTFELSSIKFINDSVGWAVGGVGTIIKTTDGGTNWEPQSSGIDYTLQDLDFFNENECLAIGGKIVFGGFSVGIILKTSDGGITWNYVSSFNSYGTGISVIDSNSVIAVGWDGLILKSTDRGESWVMQSTGGLSNELYGIYFKDSNNGFVVGSSGEILKTTNSGANWNSVASFPSAQWLYGISFTDSLNGFIVGTTHYIVKTTDGGVNWNLLSLGSFQYHSNFEIIFTDSNTGYISGPGNILRTSDKGKSWVPQYCPTNDLLKGLDFTDINHGWACGSHGALLRTTNGGLTFELIKFFEDSIYIPTLSDSGSTKIVNTSDHSVRIDSIISVGSFYGYRGFFSKPGFEYQFYLFQTLPSPKWNDSLGIVIPPHDSINISFYDVDLCPFCDYEVQEYFKDTLRFVFTFLEGNVYSFNKSIPISGEGHPSDVDGEKIQPNEFVLHQNYPNPFNPSTSIQYAIGSRQFVTLKVYDVLGNEVATLVNEYRNGGSYEINFDASKLASGIYFYQLKAGSFVETKKMVLLR